MSEYLSPGVYVEEVDTGNKPIEGVATSTAGLIGIAERGPENPTLVTSFTEFVRTFGGYVASRYLAYAVEGFFQNGGKRCFVQRVVSGAATTAPSTRNDGGMRIDAAGPGTWGDRIAVKITNAGLSRPSDAASQQLFKLTVMYWAPGVLPAGPLVDPTHPGNRTNQNRRDPTLIEVYDNLSPDPRSQSFYERVVNGVSSLVRLTQTEPGRPGNNAPENDATPVAGEPPFLEDGNDGDALTLQDFNRGLARLEEVDEIAILSCPEEGAFAGVTDAVVQQCERLKDRFAILQSPQTPPDIAAHRPTATSRYAAYYYPWLRVKNPVTGEEVLIPPGGHVAGIYARSDVERGVHKAPANEVIRGVLVDPNDPARSLQVQVTKAQQDLLNPRGVNVLRYFPGRGNLVWGARTTTLDAEWKYVNVRRLFIFVEESIEEATQWVVFEPNDGPLWARVKRGVGDFLTRLWMDGMLQGKTREEAYFVKCDRTTMTQADIDNGRLIVIVGIAPVKPAEFVIFRIGQWSGGSEVAEG